MLIKISGEALAGDKHFGLNFDVIGPVCDVIKKCNEQGCEIGVVVGGGNFWRGVKDGGGKMERTRADHMGMLATTINALALADALEQRGVPVRVQTAIEMNRIAEPYIRQRATRHLEKGRVVIFGCGTGNPFFSTDTAAVLRAAEIGAEVILLAKNVDGVYDSDPAKNPDAKKYDRLTYMDVLNQGLGVMDTTATSLSMDNHIPILVFALSDPENIYRAVNGEKIGTIVEEDKSMKAQLNAYEEKMKKDARRARQGTGGRARRPRKPGRAGQDHGRVLRRADPAQSGGGDLHARSALAVPSSRGTARSSRRSRRRSRCPIWASTRRTTASRSA